MTRTEVAEMIEFAMICYPNVQMKNMKKTLDVWSEMFAGVDAKKGMESTKKVCRESKYFPSVAEIMASVKAEHDFMKGYIEC